MKKLLVVASVASAIFATNAFADVEAQATATWSATATKDTTSELVVTALDSLAFQYAAGINGFNSQDGMFDVTIQGQSGATDFELSAKIVSNTLVNAGGDSSTLKVGASWNGEALAEGIDTLLVNGSQTAGLENLFANNVYNDSTERTSAISSFKFSIEDATLDGSTLISTSPSNDFSSLPDGYWSGDVKVQFTAVWTV